VAGEPPSDWKDSDGVNLMPYLTGQKGTRPHSTLFWGFNVVAAVRDGDWKLIRIQGASPLLFNLDADLSERNNVAAEHPDIVRDLLAKLAAWEKPFPEPRWTEGEYWEKKHFEDHTGPPVYQGPVTVPPVDQE
jgi:arylsulfatase A-like enzyme